MSAHVTSELQAAFDQWIDAQSDAPAWLNAHRRASFAAFGDLGLPTRKNEEWKYVSTKAIAKANLTPASALEAPLDTSAVADAVAQARLGDELAVLVFVGGVYNAELSTIGALPEGANVGRLADAWTRDCTEALFTNPPPFPSGFDALRGAFTGDGAYIELAPDVELDAPIHVIHVGAPASAGWLSANTNIVRLSGHSRATLVESYVGVEGAVYLGVHGTTVRLGDGSALRHLRIQNDARTAFHVATDDVIVPRDAAYHSFNFSFGAAIARDTTNVRVEGPGAHTELAALYLPDSGQTHDNHTIIDHRAPSCTADQLYKGVLEGTGHGVFNGKIFVQQIAQQTAAEQLNQNLMLSRDSKIDTKPQLEIFADDVRCTHGATVGQLEPEELFYLMSRAIPEETARRMLIRGFANDALERITHAGTADRMRALLDTRFGN